MKAEWIEIKRDDVPPQHAGLRVSMNKEGKIVINRAGYKMLGSPKAFKLLFDKVNSRIGLRPTAPGLSNAYPALKSNRFGAKMVRAFRLMREHRVILPKTVEFPDACVDDTGMLVLDLRTAVVSRRALGYEKRRKEVKRQQE